MTPRLGDDGLDLPYRGQDMTTLPTEGFLLAGGVVVAGAVAPVPELGPRPALLFRFAKPDGSGFHAPMLLILEDDQVQGVVDLISKAAEGAVTAYRGMT